MRKLSFIALTSVVALVACGDKEAPATETQQQAATQQQAETTTTSKVEAAQTAETTLTASGDSLQTMLELTREADAAFTEVLSILQGINSKQTADAAVPRLRSAFKRLETATTKLEKIDINMSDMMNGSDAELNEIEQIGMRMESNAEILMELIMSLAMNDCYGSAALNQFFEEM